MYVSPQLGDAFERCFHELWRPPGLAVGVCTAAGLVWSRCFGERRIGTGTAVDENTVFALASGTKTFAVASIAQLIGRGLLDWDTRVIDIDPAFDAGDATVTASLTVRDLACHRTGWSSSEGRHRGAASSRADLIRRLRYHGFRHPFRANFAYCTDGFTVLGHLVDTLTGMSWERYAQQQLVTPLGLSRTSFSVADAEATGNVAHPHLRLASGERVPVPWHYEDGVATPAGGANTCVADLARWLSIWLASDPQRTPWPIAQTGAMQTPQIADAGAFADKELSCAVTDGLTDEAYALGWYTHRYRGERVVHHTGSIRGFRSMIALLPDRGIGFIALANAAAVYLPRALFQATLDALQGADPLRWVPHFFALEETWHASNASRYRHESGSSQSAMGPELAGSYRDDGRFGVVRIVGDAHGAHFQAGQLNYRIVGLGGDRYRCEELCGRLVIDQGLLEFQRDSSSRVVGFHYQGVLFTRVL